MPDHNDDYPDRALLVEAARKVNKIRPGVRANSALATMEALWVMGWRPAGHTGCLTVNVQIDGKPIDEAVQLAVRQHLAGAGAGRGPLLDGVPPDEDMP